MAANAQGYTKDEVLLQLGVLGATPAQKDAILAVFFELAEMRVGLRMARLLPRELLSRVDPNSRNAESLLIGAMNEHVPDHTEIVKSEFALIFEDFAEAYSRAERSEINE